MSSKAARQALLGTSFFVALLVVTGGVLVRVGADDGYRQTITFSEVLGLVKENYVDPVDENSLLMGAYEGLLTSLDGRGAYMTPAEVAAWSQPQTNSSASTGMSIVKAGSIVQVVAVAPGSPAEGAGIKSGDQLRRVAGRPVRAMAWDQIMRELQGAPGSSVSVSVVQPRDGFKRADRDLTRAVIKTAPYTLHVERGVAVVKIFDVARIDAAALKNELRKARTDGATKLLLDVRYCVEGSPRTIAPLAGLFTTGTVLVAKDKSGKQIETVAAGGEGTAWSGDISVLVNAWTAGAAEGFAQLIHTKRNAPIYGESTFGMGSEPRLVKLPDGAGLLIPSVIWETANGKRWNEDGVKPDREIRAEYRIDKDPDEADADQLRRTLDAVVEAKPSAEAAPKAA